MAEKQDDNVFIYTPDPDAGTFKVLLAQEEVRTVDNRMFAADSIEWRTLPVPLLLQRKNDPTTKGGHKGAISVGSINEIWRETNEETGKNEIWGRGTFSSDEEGQNARNLIREGTLSNVSVDVGGALVELSEETDDEGNTELIRVYQDGIILGATVLPLSAFNDTKISVTAAITAGAGEWKPSKSLFENPQLKEPTPLTVDGDRVFGHAALWDSCHVGYRNSCVRPPKSRAQYGFFNVGQVETEEGELVNVGRIAAGINHADISFGAQAAKEHYDNTGYAGAYVVAGEDEHGIWFSGTFAPTATDEQKAVIRAASVSGDWRAINGALEMVGLLAVNSPGFPIPRSKTGIVAGAQISLIASSPCLTETTGEYNPETIVEEFAATVVETEEIIIEQPDVPAPIVVEETAEELADETDPEPAPSEEDDSEEELVTDDDEDDDEIAKKLAELDQRWRDIKVLKPRPKL